MSILIKLGLLFFLMDTFIRKAFHLEKILDISDKMAMIRPAIEAGFHGIKCQGHEAIIIAPYFWILILYGIAIVILSIALMIYESAYK